MAVEPVPSRLTQERIAACQAAGYWRDEVLGDLLEAQAQRRPDAIAVVDGPRRVTWAELYRLSRRLALHLWEMGLRPGDVVVLQLPNWVEYLVSYHAIQSLGAVVCQPGVDWRALEMEYALGLGPARAAIIPAEIRSFDFPAMVAELRSRAPQLEHVLVARGTAPEGCVSLDALLSDPIEDRYGEEILRRYRRGANEVSRLVFTSGTTGQPKAIMHTNNTTRFSSRVAVQTFGLNSNDVFLAYVPMSANFGAMLGIYMPIEVGATVVLTDRFSRTLELIERERVTYLPGTPTAFNAISNSPDLGQRDLSSLKLIMSAGANCPVEVIRAVRDRFDGLFIEAFGMNEFGMGMFTWPEDDPAEVDGSVGRPFQGVETRIADDQGQQVPVHQPGELLVRHAGMCVGYYRNPEANAESWDEDGWFHTGDLATMDSKGNIRIVGRKKDIIIRGGANISPYEVEDAITPHPKVGEVSVIGLPDPYYGEVVCACVIPNPGEELTLEELTDFLKPRIAYYKLPTRLVPRQEFPLNSMGKLVKRALREQVLESLAAGTQ